MKLHIILEKLIEDLTAKKFVPTKDVVSGSQGSTTKLVKQDS